MGQINVKPLRGDKPKRYKLPGDWGLRELIVDQHRPQWAIQYKGMDWIKIEDFLPPASNGRSSLADDMHAFAEAIGGVPVSE